MKASIRAEKSMSFSMESPRVVKTVWKVEYSIFCSAALQALTAYRTVFVKPFLHQVNDTGRNIMKTGNVIGICTERKGGEPGKEALISHFDTLAYGL